MGKKTGATAKRHRKTKAAIAAGAVASTVAATAAYRRHAARHHLGNAHPANPAEHRFGSGPSAGPEAGLGDTQPL
jgi:hypothetical protein